MGRRKSEGEKGRRDFEGHFIKNSPLRTQKQPGSLAKGTAMGGGGCRGLFIIEVFLIEEPKIEEPHE